MISNIKSNLSDLKNNLNLTVDSIKFIDLFCGIGGFRIAFENVGGQCVFSSDIDKWARETYLQNFGEYPLGDISKIESNDIPDHDVLCAGFPCQPFSIAGKRLGFSDTRGTLFFEIERIIRDKKPKAFVLENVKGLQNHDNGNTLLTIRNTLQKLGYTIFYKILNSKDFGVPQNRERIYIVGFNKVVDFEFPVGTTDVPINAFKVLEKNVEKHGLSDIASNHVVMHYSNLLKKTKVDMNKPLFATEIRPSRCVFRNDGVSPCLTAKMGTGGNNVPVLVSERRKLTVRECLRIQGFPDTYIMRQNYSQSYKQIGNSIAVPVVSAIAKEIVKFL